MNSIHTAFYITTIYEVIDTKLHKFDIKKPEKYTTIMNIKSMLFYTILVIAFADAENSTTTAEPNIQDEEEETSNSKCSEIAIFLVFLLIQKNQRSRFY